MQGMLGAAPVIFALALIGLGIFIAWLSANGKLSAIWALVNGTSATNNSGTGAPAGPSMSGVPTPAPGTATAFMPAGSLDPNYAQAVYAELLASLEASGGIPSYDPLGQYSLN